MHHTRIDLPQDKREALVEMMNGRLADAVALASHLKQAHWNVRGPHFQQLHELFDGITDIMRGFSDEIAERVAALGGLARGTVEQAAAHMTLAPYPDVVDGMAHVREVADRMGRFVATTRAAVDQAGQMGDPITEDLFTAMTRELEKHLWFVEAHLQGGA